MIVFASQFARYSAVPVFASVQMHIEHCYRIEVAQCFDIAKK